MKKIITLVLWTLCLLAFTVTAFANPYGGVPRSLTFPPDMTPVETLQYFHHKITDRDLGMAYDILTEDYKNFFKGYGAFEKGYATTFTSRPENIRVLEQTENFARLAYTLKAQDFGDEAQIIEQEFECGMALIKVHGSWMLDGGTGKLLRRTVLPGMHASAEAVLKGYHECITHKEMRAAWNLLGDAYKKSFGDFPQFCEGFKTTVSSTVSEVTPVADGPFATALEYKLTAKDVTPEANVVQVFKGMAEIEFIPGKGFAIKSASNKLIDRYFPPKW